ncbi:PTS lactose transporter subunit IIC [Campylobacterota bacterium]|nr:PTS lactose transporter subunit IIC [Campylobacterota bacterium]
MYRFLALRIADGLHKVSVPNWAYHPVMLSIRNGFLLCLPLITAGAIAILLNNLPIPHYQEVMLEIFGANWTRFGGLVWNGTFGIISIPMLIGTSYHLAALDNQRHVSDPISPIIAAITALACLMVIIPGGEMVSNIGTQGLFVALIVSIAATKIFLRLARTRYLVMPIYSEGTEASIQQAFSCLLPCIFTVSIFAAFYFAFQSVFGVDLHQAVHNALLFPFSFEFLRDALNTGISYVILIHIFWFFGIHGSNVLDPLTTELFESARKANEAALAAGLPPTDIITKHFMDIFVFMGGCGSSICLIAALLIASRSGGSRRLAKISFLPGMFNINEILLFGLPVILNPIFLFPFVFVPLILTASSFAAVYFGFVPLPAEIAWTTPPIVGGFLATGGVSGSILQFFNLAIGTLIYIPFVRISDREKAARQKKAMANLMEIALGNTVGPSGKKCLDRDDEIGVLARSLARDLEHALAHDTGLYLEYQAQVDSAAKVVIGCEALVRWRHSVYGLIPAPIMVAISEDGNFMRSLGLWVMNEACKERAKWRADGLDSHFKTSVNVSVQQLDDADFVAKVTACIQRHNLSPYMIGVEVTESIALDPQSPQNKKLEELHDLGFIISMDDFGMGHSSLVYLKYFPLDILKIDRVLSKDIVTSKTSQEVVTTIVELCKSLGIHIVVEYVETQDQIDEFLKLGCHIFQGYYFRPPVSAEKMLNYASTMNAGKKLKKIE